MERQRGLALWGLLVTFALACACPTISERFAGNPAGEAAATPSDTRFAEVVSARSIGPDNAPLEPTREFTTGDPVIYVVARATQIDVGDTLFARWFRDGAPVEDTAPIVADQPYQDVYVEFHIEPLGGGGFRPGDYRVQIYRNGEAGPTVEFAVR